MKFFLLIIFSIFLTNISYADLSDIFGDKSFDIYNIVKKDTENNIGDSVDKGLSEIEKKYDTDLKRIKKIINGDVIYCDKKLLNKLNIKLEKDGSISKANYKECQNKLLKEINNFINIDIISNDVKKTTELENLLANGKEDDGPYDLLVDVKDLSEILFKKDWKPKKLSYGKVNIGNKGETAKSIDDKLNEIINKIKGKEEEKEDLKKELNNTTDLDKKNALEKQIDDIDKDIEDFKKEKELQIIEEKQEVKNTNPDLQIGQQCGNTNNSDIENNNEPEGENNEINNTNNSNTYIAENFEDLNDEITKNQDFLFDTFNGSGSKGSFIDSIFGLGTGDNNGDGLGTLPNGGGTAPVKGCAGGSDKLLAVCIKMVPSGPNGPVGGTLRVPSIGAAINQIGNTLKDIKQSFIIPAGHGDEALDIDFKHINLADISAFNIVLTKKPAFQFKKDKNAEKQKNEAKDTLCKGVPHYLAVKYLKNGVVNCFGKLGVNKYLITNTFNVSKKTHPKISLSESNISSPTAGNKKIIDNDLELLNNIYKFTDNLDSLMEIWRTSSSALKKKSE